MGPRWVHLECPGKQKVMLGVAGVSHIPHLRALLGTSRALLGPFSGTFGRSYIPQGVSWGIQGGSEGYPGVFCSSCLTGYIRGVRGALPPVGVRPSYIAPARAHARLKGGVGGVEAS